MVKDERVCAPHNCCSRGAATALNRTQLSRLESLAAHPTETRVIAAFGATPRHVDEVVVQCGLSYGEVMTLLLTLVLEDVLVEGPEGFFRQRNPP